MSKKTTPNPKSQSSKKAPQLPDETIGEVDTETIEGSEEETEAAKPAKAAKSNFGNLDKDKKYDLSKLKVPKYHYVVRHFSSVVLANGQTMEDPTTSRLQVYDNITFENLSKQKVKDGKQVASQFEALGLNVDVLHDPTK